MSQSKPSILTRNKGLPLDKLPDLEKKVDRTTTSLSYLTLWMLNTISMEVEGLLFREVFYQKYTSYLKRFEGSTRFSPNKHYLSQRKYEQHAEHICSNFIIPQK